MDSQNGLSHDGVSSIVQDKNGYLWFGIVEGLNKYDGEKFQQWFRNPFDKNSLSSNQIQTLYIDGDILWVGTYKGLNALHIQSGNISRYIYNDGDESSLSSNVVTAISRDETGTLWVGTLNGLNKMNEEEGTFTRYFSGEEKSAFDLPHSVVRTLYNDRNGDFWVGTYGGLSRYTVESDNFVSTDLGLSDPFVMDIQSNKEGELLLGIWGTGLMRFNTKTMKGIIQDLPDNRIYKLLLDNDRIWTASYGGGLVEIETESHQAWIHHSDSSSYRSLSNDTVYSLFKDPSGIIWVGTNGGGINRIIPGWQRFELWDDWKDSSSGSARVHSLFRDSEEDIWVSLYNKGLTRFNLEGEILGQYNHDPDNPNSISNDLVQIMYQDSRQRIWVGTNKGLNLYDRERDRFISDPDSLELDLSENDNVVYTIIEDNKGQIWLGTYNEGILCFSPEGELIRHYKRDDGSGLSDNLIRDFHLTRSGELWIGTNHGLNRYDGATDKFIAYFHDEENRESLSSDVIHTLLEDQEGRFWVGTDGGGLNRYDRDNDLFQWFPIQGSSLAMTVDILYEDEREFLWVGSHQGLYRITPDREQIENVTEAIGFPHTKLSRGYTSGEKGYLYLGSDDGLVIIQLNPVNLPRSESRLTLTSFKVLDTEIYPDPVTGEWKEIRLKHNDRLIEFQFAQLNFLAGLTSVFSYRLEGFEEEWHHTEIQKGGSYSHLLAGHYTLVIRSEQNQSMDNPIIEEIHIPIFVSPPPWFSSYALFFYIILVLLVIILTWYRWQRWLVHQEMEREREKFFKEELERKVEERTHELLEANRSKEEMEDKLKQSEKLSAIGQLAGGIAHDFNNQLQGIIGFSEQLISSNLNENQSFYLDNIMMSANNASELTEKLLAFARKGHREHQSMKLDKIISEVCIIFHHSIDKRIELIREEQNPLPVIMGDRTQMQNALLNILLNSRDAIERTGKIYIRQDVKSLNAPMEGVLGETIPMGEYIFIEIEDDGMGIPEEIRKKVFEPFFTTKKINEGTGMGLSAVYGTVKSQNGYMTLESETGKGTCITMLFPVEKSV